MNEGTGAPGRLLARWRALRPRTLKARIAMVVLLLFLSAIWLSTFLLTSRLEQDFSAVLANQQFASVSHVAAEIEQKVQSRFDALATVAAAITPEMLADPRQLRALLANRPLLLALFSSGTVVISPEGTGIADYPVLPQRAASSYADIEYFREVIGGGDRVLGKARVGRFSGRPGAGFAVPVRDRDGRIAAVLAGFAMLDDPNLFGTMQRANVGKTGWIAVNDARHRMIVAISDPKRVMQPFPAPGVNVMLDKYAAGYEGSGISINSQGRQVLSSAKQIGQWGWFVQAVLPTDEAFEPLQGMHARAYALAAALSAIAALVVWFSIRRMLRPLAAAAADIHAMTAGDRQLRELPIGRQDEVGELLVSFNALFRQRRALEKELARQARTDPLTGLANRRHFREAAAQELARVQRFGGSLSLIMLDIDLFKSINDTYGHDKGDAVLQALAETCRRTLREVDVIARLGGEEFAILLPATDRLAAIEAAERVRVALADTQVPLKPGTVLRFSASFGVASYVDPQTSLDMLLNSADLALYEAKRAGRNLVRAAA